MTSKKGFILMATVPSYSVVQSSRALHIFSELSKEFQDMYLIMQSYDKNEVELDNLIQVRPFISMDGSFSLLKGMLYRLQLTLFAFRFAIRHHLDFAILRGYDSIMLLILLKLIGVRVYSDFHGKYDLELSQRGKHLRGFFVKYIDRTTLKFSDRIIVVSEGIEAQIQEYKEKCILVPNGIDVQKIDDANNYVSTFDLKGYKKVVGFVGNWESFMNVEDMCQAAEYIPEVLFVIVGEGFNASQLMEKYRIYDNVIFAGRRPQKEAFSIMHKFDICILPYDKMDAHSRYPGFFSSRKTKEYIAAGKPIIVADVIGKESCLIPGYNCVLYESRDPRDLADKISEMFSDTSLLASMGKNNFDVRERFTWNYLIQNSGIIKDLQEN
ncbi:glycosyltransferase family 4 protein [Methanomethylovorans sp. PtaU1.Bin093]|jgi:glycosyltransferase involved in cell wall biosynthesis|uniref:glycosyltransferase family 4 protein n=1 Tax=Methanomethylovorans sp. PtaU1.Bin093 TaxID=1811679 RepID=UPI0025E796FE|nr:glycosyltransferase family 4 protein [Methanomethylovorans sp. PtaU1.Bin093]